MLVLARSYIVKFIYYIDCFIPFSFYVVVVSCIIGFQNIVFAASSLFVLIFLVFYAVFVDGVEFLVGVCTGFL